MAGFYEGVLSSLIPFKVTVVDGFLGASRHHTGVHHDDNDRKGNERCPVHFLGQLTVSTAPERLSLLLGRHPCQFCQANAFQTR